MELQTKKLGIISVVEVSGEIDANTAPDLLNGIEPLVTPKCKILLDLSHVTFMSSAGLRTMVVLYRKVSGSQGKIVLAGLVEDVKDTMEVTGFLRFFTVYETADKAIGELE